MVELEGRSSESQIFDLKHTAEAGFPDGSVVKNPLAKAGVTGDVGSILGTRRCPGEINGIPHQYSCLGNPMDRGVQQATVHGVTESQT